MKLKNILILILVVILLFPTISESKTLSVEGQEILVNPAKPEEVTFVSESIESYGDLISRLPSFMKSLIGDDKLRVHVKLISGETLLARVDTEHGSIKNIEIFGSIDPLNEEVMRRSGKLIFDGDEIHFTGALYLDEFTIIRLVQSKDPVQGFVKSWNKEIRYEGISFESKLKSFIFNIGTGFFSIHDFFVNIGEACPLEEISGEFCSGGSASSSHSGSKVKTYNVTSDFANVCDEMDEKGPGGFWGQCLYTIKYDYCVEFKGIVDKEKCECECVTKATSALGKSLNDKFNKLSNEHEKEQVSTMMRQSMERRKAQHWIVQTPR